MVRDTIWPDGILRKEAPVRTEREKAKTKMKASVLIETLCKDVMGNLVGGVNAEVGARKIFAALQNPYLNGHLAFTVLEELTIKVFSDVSALRRVVV